MEVPRAPGLARRGRGCRPVGACPPPHFSASSTAIRLPPHRAVIDHHAFSYRCLDSLPRPTPLPRCGCQTRGPNQGTTRPSRPHCRQLWRALGASRDPTFGGHRLDGHVPASHQLARWRPTHARTDPADDRSPLGGRPKPGVPITRLRPVHRDRRARLPRLTSALDCRVRRPSSAVEPVRQVRSRVRLASPPAESAAGDRCRSFAELFIRTSRARPLPCPIADGRRPSGRRIPLPYCSGPPRSLAGFRRAERFGVDPGQHERGLRSRTCRDQTCSNPGVPIARARGNQACWLLVCAGWSRDVAGRAPCGRGLGKALKPFAIGDRRRAGCCQPCCLDAFYRLARPSPVNRDRYRCPLAAGAAVSHAAGLQAGVQRRQARARCLMREVSSWTWS